MTDQVMQGPLLWLTSPRPRRATALAAALLAVATAAAPANSPPDDVAVVDRSLSPAIAAMDRDLPFGAAAVPEPRLWMGTLKHGAVGGLSTAGACLEGASRDACSWQPGFHIADLDGLVYAAAVHDDGSGPALYVGGDFTAASGTLVNHIARWNGTAWTAIGGPSGTGTDGIVLGFAVFDDGSGPALYVGGDFTTAGGVTANNIARWDGTNWSALSGPSGTGTDAWVYALTVFDDGSGPTLAAGGGFTIAGGVTANHVATWDGTAWSALSGPAGTGTDHWVYSLAVYDSGSGPDLYVGGVFSNAGGLGVSLVARWDGSAWSPLTDPSGAVGGYGVFALAVFDDGSGPVLYAGGDFGIAGTPQTFVARWNGTAWSSLGDPTGNGMDGPIFAFAPWIDASEPALYAGGNFTTAGGVTVDHVARWDGSAWSALAAPSGAGTDDTVYAVAVFDSGSGPALFAGGRFGTAGGAPATRIASWDGSSWSALSAPTGAGADNGVACFALFDDGSGPALYAGGAFITAGGVRVNGVARWDGSGWSALGDPSGTGVNGSVSALAEFDDGSGPALYVGGYFTDAGGVTANNIARWDGTAWSPLPGPNGTGADNPILALAVFDDGSGPALYAGGSFATAGGVPVNRIARWDGIAWSPLSSPSGTGVGGSYPWVSALAVVDLGSGPALYVGGYFTSAGGIAVSNIARWNGSVWSGLPGTNSQVNGLGVFDDGSGPALYGGGGFTTAGGVTVNHVARWDGASWSALSGPGGTGTDSTVIDFAVFDDGTGPALVAGGGFLGAGGVTANGIARWDGSAWSAFTTAAGTGMSGANPSVAALVAVDSGSGPVLYTGGTFAVAGGIVSTNIAAWWCDALAPTDPTSLWSPTHTPGAWSAANVAEVAWSGATDSGGSGLTGYSVLFDTEPATVPDTTVDVPQTGDPHSTGSGVLPDGGNHWFHLRTCDGAGNCSSGVHLGPFLVDTTPPSGPFNLTSTSHTPGEPSWDRSVDMVWASAVDTGSGLDGYAWAVAGAAPWPCDQVRDLEEDAVSLTTPDLADGLWFVHLCAEDNLGNWGDVVTAGPFLVFPLFADGFESGETTVWSLAVP